MRESTMNDVENCERGLQQSHHDLDLHETNPRRERERRKIVSFLGYPGGPAPDSEVPSAIKVRSSSLDSPLSPRSQLSSPPSIMQSPTMETVESTVSGQAQANGEQHHTVTIEHKTGGKKRSSTARKISKPVIALIGTIILVTSGSAAYFFSEFLTIPGLKTQVDRLEDQVALLESQVNELESQVNRLGGEVDRLGYEVERLSNETDRLEALNEELGHNVDAYAEQNDRLNSTLVVYAHLNEQLNQKTISLKDEVDSLTEQITIFAGLNDELNQTVLELTDDVSQLDSINRDLSRANEDLWQSIDQLVNETAELSLRNELLNATVIALDNQVVLLSNETDRLASLTTKLTTVVSFLNETAVDIDETFEQFIDFLSDRVIGYRSLVMQTLENMYRQKAAFWDCDFRDYFSLDKFTQERNAPIGPSSYPEVIEYIQKRVLSDMCLNSTNFELFMVKEMAITSDPSAVSFNQLQRSVGTYTDLAVNYYFSSAEDGIDSEVWSEANYDCRKLPSNARFLYTSQDAAS